MARAKLMVFTSPADPEDHDAFNHWYNTIHVPQVLTLPGFVSARRYVLADAQIHADLPPSGHHYMAEYDLEADDIQASLEALRNAGTERLLTRGGQDGRENTSNEPRTIAFTVEMIADEFPPAPPLGN